MFLNKKGTLYLLLILFFFYSCDLAFHNPFIADTYTPDANQVSLPEMSPSSGTEELAEMLCLELNNYGFVEVPDKLAYPLDSTKPGIFACGYAHSPRDIPDSVVQGSGAAARAARALAGGS